MNLVQQFHFLRPWWLLALLPSALVWWRMFWRDDALRAWQQWVDPLLLEALLVRGGTRRRLRPVHLLGVFWLVGVVALAGPTWRREPSPFAEDQAALVIALKVAESMQQTDIAPSRLQRAAQKISDLLGERAGARNALIAYAGRAHLVMPLTTDAGVINTFAADLSPELMPEPGDEPSRALAAAQQRLQQSGQPGAILFVTDDWNDSALAALNEHRREGGAPVHVLAALADAPEFAVNKPALAALWQAARTVGGSFAVITPDSSDVERLARSIQRTARTGAAGSVERWRDAGYWLLPVLAGIGVFWFRRGWVVGHE